MDCLSTASKRSEEIKDGSIQGLSGLVLSCVQTFAGGEGGIFDEF